MHCNIKLPPRRGTEANVVEKPSSDPISPHLLSSPLISSHLQAIGNLFHRKIELEILEIYRRDEEMRWGECQTSDRRPQRSKGLRRVWSAPIAVLSSGPYLRIKVLSPLGQMSRWQVGFVDYDIFNVPSPEVSHIHADIVISERKKKD